MKRKVMVYYTLLLKMYEPWTSKELQHVFVASGAPEPLIMQKLPM
jgi:hypothetical protein